MGVFGAPAAFSFDFLRLFMFSLSPVFPSALFCLLCRFTLILGLRAISTVGMVLYGCAVNFGMFLGHVVADGWAILLVLEISFSSSSACCNSWNCSSLASATAVVDPETFYFVLETFGHVYSSILLETLLLVLFSFSRPFLDQQLVYIGDSS